MLCSGPAELAFQCMVPGACIGAIRLELLERVDKRTHLVALAQRAALIACHRRTLGSSRTLPHDLNVLVDAAVVLASDHGCLFAARRLGSFGEAVHVGDHRGRGAHQTRVGVDTRVRFCSEVPLASRFRLVDLGIARTIAVFRRSGRGNRCRVDSYIRPEYQALTRQRPGDDGVEGFDERSVVFLQSGKARDGALVAQQIIFDDGSHEAPVRGYVAECSLNRWVGETDHDIAA